LIVAGPQMREARSPVKARRLVGQWKQSSSRYSRPAWRSARC
jgi:hypothetical protein